MGVRPPPRRRSSAVAPPRELTRGAAGFAAGAVLGLVAALLSPRPDRARRGGLDPLPPATGGGQHRNDDPSRRGR